MRGQGFFNLAKERGSGLHGELECKVKKLKHKKLEVMQSRIKNETNPNFQLVNKPSSRF